MSNISAYADWMAQQDDLGVHTYREMYRVLLRLHMIGWELARKYGDNISFLTYLRTSWYRRDFAHVYAAWLKSRHATVYENMRVIAERHGFKALVMAHAPIEVAYCGKTWLSFWFHTQHNDAGWAGAFYVGTELERFLKELGVKLGTGVKYRMTGTRLSLLFELEEVK